VDIAEKCVAAEWLRDRSEKQAKRCL
jgi:hypothetical protein